ncbi:MAG: hypothetical protein AVDCRST_MAG36-1770 [uncultured Nocardioidaceae bacterium]|uniref:DUF2530 domain-containing protein n=1 Tax=uncultured Nocardioidaceae bacterium TaxID=253824 RepID=A0A6J4M2B8_9ACTN|nr:MAG: hypothetical protein AVDCRST_MAG36-1770 [uncultured Nocardioidaceae bacterium]
MEPRAPEPEAFPPPSLKPALTRRAAAAGEQEAGRRYLIADVEPLDVTGVRTVVVGTVLFVLAFLALLPFTDDLRATDRLWVLWTCGAGVGLGLFGVRYCRRRAAALAARSREG